MGLTQRQERKEEEWNHTSSTNFCRGYQSFSPIAQIPPAGAVHVKLTLNQIITAK